MARIALDVMGGDRGPAEAVAAAHMFIRDTSHTVLLVGDKVALEPLLREGIGPTPRLELIHAPSQIQMDEVATRAVRRKPSASLNVAVCLARDGLADAVVSAGHTGAVVVSCAVHLEHLLGVDRPALAVVIPTQSGQVVLLDVGANVQVKPHQLVQFGQMGSAWARECLGVESPRVGLLSNGSEVVKATQNIRLSHELCQAQVLGYVGLVEGMDLFAGHVDVAVCDGFVGNILLKGLEGAVELVLTRLGQGLNSLTMPASFRQDMLGQLNQVGHQLDYAEQGGALLLGLNRVVVVAHGRSDQRALTNALLLAGRCVDADLVLRMRERLQLGRSTGS